MLYTLENITWLHANPNLNPIANTEPTLTLSLAPNTGSCVHTISSMYVFIK